MKSPRLHLQASQNKTTPILTLLCIATLGVLVQAQAQAPNQAQTKAPNQTTNQGTGVAAIEAYCKELDRFKKSNPNRAHFFGDMSSRDQSGMTLNAPSHSLQTSNELNAAARARIEQARASIVTVSTESESPQRVSQALGFFIRDDLVVSDGSVFKSGSPLRVAVAKKEVTFKVVSSGNYFLPYVLVEKQSEVSPLILGDSERVAVNDSVYIAGDHGAISAGTVISITTINRERAFHKSAPTNTEPSAASSVDTKPRRLRGPMPQYTDAARAKGTEGTVILRVLVGDDGEVKQVRVVRELPDGLTEQAIEAARQTKFKPAMKDGKGVPFWVVVEMEFHIR